MESRNGRWTRLTVKLILSASLILAIVTVISRFVPNRTDRPGPFPGYTLISPLASTKTYLIDMQGRIVRTWKSEYTAGQDAILLENGHLLRGGQLLPEERFFAGFASGGRVQEFTWTGELVWDFKLHNERQLSHHDLARLPNGNVLLIVWEIKTAAETLAAGRKPELVEGPWLVDSVLEIKPTGKTTGEVVWEWHAWDHLIQDSDSSRANYGGVAAHPELIDINYGESLTSELSGAGRSPQEDARKKNDLDTLRSIGYVGSRGSKGTFALLSDWTHVNSVAYNAELDQILLSVRSFSEFWIIDHGTTSAIAKGHSGGRAGKGGDLLYRWGNSQAYRAGTKADQRLFAQHDAQWIPRDCPGQGHVLVFNNGLGRPGGDYASVDEIELPLDAENRYVRQPESAYGPRDPVWSYTAPVKTDFSARFMSGAQRLPNGNTLICNGISGTVFEVTANKQVVWSTSIEPATPEPAGPRPAAGNSGDSSRPQEILSSSLRDNLKLSSEQKQLVDDLQEHVDARLDSIMPYVQQRLRNRGDAGADRLGGVALPGQIMPLSTQIFWKLTDEQRKAVAELQNQVDARLSELMTAGQRARFKELKDEFSRGKTAGTRPVGPNGPGPNQPAGPASAGDSGGPPGPVFRVHRYGAGYAGLADKDLTPGATR